MNASVYNGMKYIINIVEKITDANIQIKGFEKIPSSNPIIFASNHFTRMETLIIPYMLYKKTGKAIRVVADDSLFVSYFGTVLEKLGIVPVGHKNRNNIITSDLLKGESNWLIFPEGSMVKNKCILKRDGHYFIKNDKGAIRKVRSGTAFFALKAQMLRNQYQSADDTIRRQIQNRYKLEENIQTKDTAIVPINVSYIPLHPKENIIAKTARKFVGDMAPRIMEELKVEGELLLTSKIIIQIGEPEFMQHWLDEKQEDVFKCGRIELIDKVMDEVYGNITFQFDHFFALIIDLFPKPKISKTHLKRLLYCLILHIKDKFSYHFDENLLCGYLNLVSDEEYKPLTESLEIAIEQGIIEEIVEDSFSGYKINKEMLNAKSEFHMIRLDNTFKVLINETKLYEDFREEAKKYIEKDEETLYNELFEEMIKDEERRYEKDYEKYKNEEGAKDKKIGYPYFLNACKSGFCGNRIGVIFSHGYSSTPKEVREASEFLQSYGIDVYAPRLNGHGTAPSNLKECSWEDWYGAFSKAYAILSLKCTHIYLVGFSTGGLLALLAAGRKTTNIAGVICINAALRLNDIRMNYVLPAVTFWNDLVKLIDSPSLGMEHVENHPEFPELNYDRYYLKSIKELSKLMNVAKNRLPKVTAPILVIQATKDPVVNPDVAQSIISEISSSYKSLIYLNLDRHVIIRGKGKELLFNEILSFIKKNRNIVDWEDRVS